MKKVISLLTCLVLTLIISVSVFAAGTINVNSNTSTNILKSGDTVTVTVSISNCAPFKSMALTPSFDSNIFEMVSGKWLLTDAVLANFNNTNAAVAFSSEVTKNGNVFEYVLKAKNTTAINTTIKTNAIIKNGSTSIENVINSATVKVICKNHSFSSWSNVDNGHHNHTCSVCGTVEIGSHTWNSGVITKPATCKENGIKTYTCTVCNAKKTESIAKTNGHKFGEYVVTKAATCTADGIKSRTCSVCNKAETVSIKATGHKMGNWSTVKAAACTQKGEQQCKCANCLYTESRTVAALGHDFENPKVVKEATLYSEGLIEGKCRRCGESTKEVIPCSAKDDVTGVEIDTFVGVFAQGTKIVVEEVKDDAAYKTAFDSISKKHVIYEISALQNGSQVQPNGEVTIALPVSNEFSDNIAVYALSADGNAEKKEITVSADAKTAFVKTNKIGVFSVCDLNEAGEIVEKVDNGTNITNSVINEPTPNNNIKVYIFWGVVITIIICIIIAVLIIKRKKSSDRNIY